MEKRNLLDSFNNGAFYGQLDHMFDIDSGRARYAILLHSKDYGYIRHAAFDSFAMAAERYKEAVLVANRIKEATPGWAIEENLTGWVSENLPKHLKQIDQALSENKSIDAFLPDDVRNESHDGYEPVIEEQTNEPDAWSVGNLERWVNPPEDAFLEGAVTNEEPLTKAETEALRSLEKGIDVSKDLPGNVIR